MTFSATLTLKNPRTKDIVAAIGKIDIDSNGRIKTEIKHTSDTLTINMDAKDPIALRAGLNSFMNHYNLSYNMIKGISHGKRDR